MRFNTFPWFETEAGRVKESFDLETTTRYPRLQVKNLHIVTQLLFCTGSRTWTWVWVIPQHVTHTNERKCPNHSRGCPWWCSDTGQKSQALLKTLPLICSCCICWPCKVQNSGVRWIKASSHETIFNGTTVFHNGLRCGIRLLDWELNMSDAVRPHVDHGLHCGQCISQEQSIWRKDSGIQDDQCMPGKGSLIKNPESNIAHEISKWLKSIKKKTKSHSKTRCQAICACTFEEVQLTGVQNNEQFNNKTFYHNLSITFSFYVPEVKSVQSLILRSLLSESHLPPAILRYLRNKRRIFPKGRRHGLFCHDKLALAFHPRSGVVLACPVTIKVAGKTLNNGQAVKHRRSNANMEARQKHSPPNVNVEKHFSKLLSKP